MLYHMIGMKHNRLSKSLLEPKCTATDTQIFTSHSFGIDFLKKHQFN